MVSLPGSFPHWAGCAELEAASLFLPPPTLEWSSSILWLPPTLAISPVLLRPPASLLPGHSQIPAQILNVAWRDRPCSVPQSLVFLTQPGFVCMETTSVLDTHLVGIGRS